MSFALLNVRTSVAYCQTRTVHFKSYLEEIKAKIFETAAVKKYISDWSLVKTYDIFSLQKKTLLSALDMH